MNWARFTTTDITNLVAALLLGAGLWLLLPRGTPRGRGFGVVFILAALGLYAAKLWPLGDLASDTVFYVMTAVTLVSAVGAVTMRSPVYCAIWFALTLLGTAGLFFFQGAQFLGVATVVVYAGAILVTFLFVLMLCNPEGHALYDRLSWEAGISAVAGALLVGLLTWTATNVAFADRTGKTAASPTTATPTVQADERASGSIRFAADQKTQADKILATNHVEKLGAELFSRHLLAVEVAGTLLLVALVGAVAIAAYGKGATTIASNAEVRRDA